MPYLCLSVVSFHFLKAFAQKGVLVFAFAVFTGTLFTGRPSIHAAITDFFAAFNAVENPVSCRGPSKAVVTLIASFHRQSQFSGTMPLSTNFLN